MRFVFGFACVFLMIACTASAGPETTANAGPPEAQQGEPAAGAAPAAAAPTAEAPAPGAGAATESASVAAEPTGRVVVALVPYGVVMPRHIWRFAAPYRAGAIDVCWEHGAMAFAQERGWVRSAVEGAWQRNSGLTFTGWGECPHAQTRGIRIAVVDSDASPRVRAFGRGLTGLAGGLELNFSFAIAQAYWRAQPEGWPFDDCTQPANRETCIRATAIHEFGHAIALAHEQMHADTPAGCHHEAKDGTQVDITAHYDPMSVMNYCRPDRMRALTLSAMDVRTVQALYCRQGYRTCGGYQVDMIIE